MWSSVQNYIKQNLHSFAINQLYLLQKYFIVPDSKTNVRNTFLSGQFLNDKFIFQVAMLSSSLYFF